jgi:hypothetical protein
MSSMPLAKRLYWVRLKGDQMTIMTLTTMALLLGLSSPAVLAQPPAHSPGKALGHGSQHAPGRINSRQVSQKGRLTAGVKQGDLTRKEATSLRGNQKRINRFEARSRADGPGLTALERQRLERMQDRQSQAIHNQRHDEHTR